MFKLMENTIMFKLIILISMFMILAFGAVINIDHNSSQIKQLTIEVEYLSEKLNSVIQSNKSTENINAHHRFTPTENYHTNEK